MTKSISLSDLHKHVKADYWITCASFEERCLTPKHIVASDQLKKLIVYYTEEMMSKSEQNRNLLSSHFGKVYEEHEFKLSQPLGLADLFVESLRCLHGMDDVNILIDISTFPRESLLILIKYFYDNRSKLHNVFIVYRTAEASDNLTEGIMDVRSILGYMGEIESDSPLHLILLLGFEVDRAKAIISIIEPDFISIGYGTKASAVDSEHYKKNVRFTENLRAYFSSENVGMFEYSITDPLQTKQALLSQVNSKNNYSTVVLPLNNKMSSVGAGLAAIEEQQIQLCYAQAVQYNLSDYSTPLDTVVLSQLEFADTPES